MDDRNIQVSTFKYDNNVKPYTTITLSSKQTKKAVNLKDRYEILLDKINDEILQQKLSLNQENHGSTDISEENPSKVFSSVSSKNNVDENFTSKYNQQNSNKIVQKKETVDDYIHNLLLELNQWNETWEKCIIMATKVIKYHEVSTQNTDQQRAILIDIVQKLCGTIIAETNFLNTNEDNISQKKYRELVEKRDKDKKRLKKMQKRCEKLYGEVQKNREMIELISKNSKEQPNEDNFIEALITKNKKNKIDKKILEERQIQQSKQRTANDEKFKNEMKNLHKKRKERMKSKQIQDSNNNFNSTQSHNSSNYYDTNNSFAYDVAKDSNYSYNYYSNDSEPDSMLYSNHVKTQLSSNKSNNEDETFPKNNNNKYAHNLNKMISIVNNLEKKCNQMQTNFDNQVSVSSKTKSKRDSIYSRSSSISEQYQIQQNGNELSLESLEKMHISLAEAERNFSTS